MRNEEIREVAQNIIDTIDNKDNTILRAQFFYELKESLRKLHDCYHAWGEYDKAKDAEVKVAGVHPVKILTNIQDIQLAKMEMDQDLDAAICTITDRFKERTNLFINGIDIEMYNHKNSRGGKSSVLDQVVTGVVTKVEL